MLKHSWWKTYSTDGQPHSKVAQNDDSQRKDAACNHKNNHVGHNSRVVTATEYIRSTGSFQSMGPIPDTRSGLVFTSCSNTQSPLCISTDQRIILIRLQNKQAQKKEAADYLLHPKMGGAHHTAAHTQENTIPPVAHLASNLTFPKGLHTTIHLSQEMIVRDQRAAIPV